MTKGQTQSDLPQEISVLPALSSSSHSSNGLSITSIDDVEKIACLAVSSGFFKNATDASKAVMVMLWGMDNGMSPVQALNDVYCINGKMSMYARALSSQIHKVPGLFVKTLELSGERCELALIYKGSEVGREVFTIKEAEEMGYTKNPKYRSDPKAMLYARCISNLHYRYAQGYTHMDVYTVEEMEASQPSIDADYRETSLKDSQALELYQQGLVTAETINAEKKNENDTVTGEMMQDLRQAADANQGMSRQDLGAYIKTWHLLEFPEDGEITKDNFNDKFTCKKYWRLMQRINGPRFWKMHETKELTNADFE